MALKTAYEIRCSCGANFHAEIYEYIFTALDHQLKDKILSGEFNSVICPYCGEILTIENRFLYRDEKNRLWIWVCKKGEKSQRKKLEKELLDENAFIEGTYVHDVEYRKFLVFGRDELIELLLREDKPLRRQEQEALKNNPAIRLTSGCDKDPGYFFLNGEKIKMISMPLRLSKCHKDLSAGPQEKNRWLKFYAQGLNIHNAFSSFLSHQLILEWNQIRLRKPIKKLNNEFEDFAESWAAYKMDAKRFKASYPERYEFLKNVRKMQIPRKIISHKL